MTGFDNGGWGYQVRFIGHATWVLIGHYMTEEMAQQHLQLDIAMKRGWAGDRYEIWYCTINPHDYTPGVRLETVYL